MTIIRRRTRFALAAGLLLAAGAVAAGEPGDGCRPVDELEEFLQPGRVFLLGELHGTEQSPSYAFSVACQAAREGYETIVGLELAATAQSRVDRYLDSEGRPEDRDALLDHPMWTRDYQDGRNSRAMAGLIENVRALRRAGRSIGILFFDASAAGGAQDRERRMADRLAASMRAHPESVHVVLTGNLHSRVTPGWARKKDYRPMGDLLLESIEPDRLLAFDVAHEGGTAWICAPECGVTQLRGRSSKARWSFEIVDRSRPSAHHGWYYVGPLSASLPAVGHHAPPAPPPAPAVETRAEAPAAPPGRKTVAADSPEVTKLQGKWQSRFDGEESWWIEFDGLDFYAEVSKGDWYRGRIFVRPGDELSEMDILIEDCMCGHKGESSDAIYRWEGEGLRMGTPVPGNPRPTFFNQAKGEVVTLERFAEESPD